MALLTVIGDNFSVVNLLLGDNKNRNMEKPVVKLRFPNFKYVSFAENISKMIIFST